MERFETWKKKLQNLEPCRKASQHPVSCVDVYAQRVKHMRGADPLGNPATVSPRSWGFRPVALRPTLSVWFAFIEPR